MIITQLALLVAAASGTATAPQDGSEQISETLVVTLSRDAQKLSKTSRSLDVISQEALKLERHSHIQQVLNTLPGVNFHRNSGQEYLAAIRSPVLTGAGACGEFLILENGLPVRPAGLCNVNELFEVNHFQADSIEILRGPATAAYGSNGLHGVINVITPEHQSEQDRTSVTIGENGYVKLGQTSHFDNLSAALTLTKDDGFRASSGFEQQLATIKHLSEGDDLDVQTWLTMFNLDQDTAGFLVGLNSFRDEQLSQTNANPEAYRQGHGARLYQTYTWGSGLQISPYLRHSAMEFMLHFLPGQAIEQNSQTSVGVQTSQNFALSEVSSLKLGLDAEYADIRLQEYQPNSTLGSAFLQATVPAGQHYDYRVDSVKLASFATYHWRASDNLTLDTGLRAEFIQFDYDNRMIAGRTDDMGQPCGFGGCRFNRPADRKDDFFELSPQLGVNYQISPESHWYLALSHGFRMPQATELYRLQREQTVADLAPTKLTGVDAGWRYQGDKISLSVAAYQYRKSNAIIRNTEFFNISGSDTKHRGVELAMSYQFNANLSGDINASYAKHSYGNNPDLSRQDIVGLDIDTAPRQMANGFLTYNSGQFTWQLQGQYVGDYYTDIENQHSYSGHVLWHSKLSYQITDELSFTARVYNLTDKRYAERADFSSFAGDRYFPGKGRNANFSIELLY